MGEKLARNCDLLAAAVVAALLGFGSITGPVVEIAANLETLPHVSVSELPELPVFCLGGFELK